MNVEVYRDDSGEWRWRRVADNGEIVATGEAYTRKHDARSSAEQNFPDDEIVESDDA